MDLMTGTRNVTRGPGKTPPRRCLKCGYVHARQRWSEIGELCPSRNHEGNSPCNGTFADTRVATPEEFQTRQGLQGWD